MKSFIPKTKSKKEKKEAKKASKFSKEQAENIRLMLTTQIQGQFEPFCSSWLREAQTKEYQRQIESLRPELRQIGEENIRRFGAIGVIADSASKILEAESAIISNPKPETRTSEKRIAKIREKMLGNAIDKKLSIAASELEHLSIREQEIAEAIAIEICSLPQIPTWSEFRYYCGESFFFMAKLLRKYQPDLVDKMKFDTKYRVASPMGKLLDSIPDRSIWADGYTGETFMGEKKPKERFGSLERSKEPKKKKAGSSRPGEKKAERFNNAIAKLRSFDASLASKFESETEPTMKLIRAVETLINFFEE